MSVLRLPLVCVIALASGAFPAHVAFAKNSEKLMVEPYPVAPPPPNSELHDLVPEPDSMRMPESKQESQEEIALQPKSSLKDMPASVHGKPITGRWETPAGADMKQTLEIWSKESGVSLVWDMSDRFVIRDTIVMEGTFEAAVAVLLEQYTAQDTRPVGNLHINPEGGQRVLIIQTVAN